MHYTAFLVVTISKRKETPSDKIHFLMYLHARVRTLFYPSLSFAQRWITNDLACHSVL